MEQPAKKWSGWGIFTKSDDKLLSFDDSGQVMVFRSRDAARDYRGYWLPPGLETVVRKIHVLRA